MPRQLVVDTIPPDFSPETHVALGPWCFFGVEDVYPEWDSLDFVDPFADAEARKDAGRVTRALAHTLLDRLWPQMNRRHGVNYSREFWRVVLIDWLLHLTMMCWRIWAHVEAFIARSGTEPFNVSLLVASSPFQFATTQDFVVAARDPSDFRTWLINEIVRRLARRHWRVANDRTISPQTVSPLILRNRRRRSVENIAMLAMGGWRVAYAWQWATSLYVNLLPRRKARPPAPPFRASTNFSTPFLELVDELVESTLPQCLGPGFKTLDADAKAQRYRRGRLNVVYMNPHDDQQSVRRAHAVEAGERVVPVQHGGVYGWGAPDTQHVENEYSYEAFATWGWTKYEDETARFVPLPSVTLGTGLGLARRSGENWVFVSSMMIPLYTRFDITPTHVEYRRWKKRFFSALPAVTTDTLLYRPYLSRHSFADVDWLRRFIPNLKTIDGRLHDVMFASRLAVIDHPFTTFPIAMACGIPTIGFWQKDAWPLSRQAAPYFAELEDAGILFGKPEDAARQVAAVLDRAEEWWREPPVARARIRWCEKYAHADRRWWLTWWKILPSI